MLRLTRWMADRYLASWGQALETVLPAVVRKHAGTRKITLLALPADVVGRVEQIAEKLPAKQAEVLRFLAAHPEPLTPVHLMAAVKCSAGPLHLRHA